MHIYSLQLKKEFIEYILCVLHVVENPGITTIFEVSTNLPISTSDRIRYQMYSFILWLLYSWYYQVECSRSDRALIKVSATSCAADKHPPGILQWIISYKDFPNIFVLSQRHNLSPTLEIITRNMSPSSLIMGLNWKHNFARSRVWSMKKYKSNPAEGDGSLALILINPVCVPMSYWFHSSGSQV